MAALHSLLSAHPMSRLYTTSPGASVTLLITALSPEVALGSSTKSCEPCHSSTVFVLTSRLAVVQKLGDNTTRNSTNCTVDVHVVSYLWTAVHKER